jgi:hypothetical protein
MCGFRCKCQGVEFDMTYKFSLSNTNIVNDSKMKLLAYIVLSKQATPRVAHE